MEKNYIVEMKRDPKGRYYLMSGQVIHPKDNPKDYRIDVRKKDAKFIIAIGGKGVYILTRELLTKCAEKEWKRYLEKYLSSPRRGKKSKGDEVRHPNVIHEDTIREVLREEGYDPCNCRFIDLEPETPKDKESVEKLLDEVMSIVQKAKEKARA
ncbi:MAG: hypothetical protein GXO18_02145 [Aquificae bacterium]|nr:hypothetical protein [Aquificota bacterium]